MEPASGIEPPTYGLRINWWGVAEVLDWTGNPLLPPVQTPLMLFISLHQLSLLFSSVCLSF